MGQLTHEILSELASIAGVRSDPTKGDAEPSDAIGFNQRDIRDIENFKNAVFQVLMLRARNYMYLTQQQREVPLPESERLAMCSFEMLLTSGMIHKVADFEIKGPMVEILIIPPRPAQHLLDSKDISDILEKFGKSIFLACKQGSFLLGKNN